MAWARVNRFSFLLPEQRKRAGSFGSCSGNRTIFGSTKGNSVLASDLILAAFLQHSQSGHAVLTPSPKNQDSGMGRRIVIWRCINNIKWLLFGQMRPHIISPFDIFFCSIFLFLICKKWWCVCGCVCAHAHVYMRVCFCVEAERQPQGRLQKGHQSPLRWGLSLAWNFPNSIGWLVSEPQGCFCFHLPRAWINFTDYSTL